VSSTTTHEERKAKPIACVVTSDSMNKSRVGTLERKVKHPTYKKYINRSTKLMFHDEKNETKVGDKVLIEPSKPYSANKSYCLIKVVSAAQQL